MRSGLWSIHARTWEGGSNIDKCGVVCLQVGREIDSFWGTTESLEAFLDPCLEAYIKSLSCFAFVSYPPKYILANLPLRIIQDMTHEGFEKCA